MFDYRIMKRLHRLEIHENKEKSVESFFVICVIKRAKSGFSELSLERGKAR